MEVVSPLVSRRRPEARSRGTVVAVATTLLMALALVALASMDGSSSVERRADQPTELFLKAFHNKIKDLLGKMKRPATTVTKETRGSIPTDEQEAEVIMGSNKNLEKNMGNLFLDGGVEERGHTNPEAVADAIVDAANNDNEDVTGKRGEDFYNKAVENSAHPERLTGSLPTYRAESTFITSGIVGNYEKSLEKGPLIATSVDGHASPRTVANGIIDEAVKAGNDCTGAVGSDGTQSTGTPNCPPVEVFNNQLHKIEAGVGPEEAPAVPAK